MVVSLIQLEKQEENPTCSSPQQIWFKVPLIGNENYSPFLCLCSKIQCRFRPSRINYRRRKYKGHNLGCWQESQFWHHLRSEFIQSFPSSRFVTSFSILISIIDLLARLELGLSNNRK